MKSWEEVENSPEYKALSDEDKARALSQYNAEYVINSKWKSVEEKEEFKALPDNEKKLALEQFRNDPAYQMSMPSKNPENVLGYYQWANVPVEDPQSPYRGALEHPLRREGFKPYYDVYGPPSYDPLNMGEKSRMWGATLPSGMNWRQAKEQLSSGLDDKAAEGLYKYLSEGKMEEGRRSDLKYSDQTAYFNQAVQSQDRANTVGHESTHRGISKMAEKVWGGIDLKTNMLMTRVMDYKYGDKAAREKAIPFIKHLSPDQTLEGGINQAMPLIEELTNAVKDEI